MTDSERLIEAVRIMREARKSVLRLLLDSDSMDIKRMLHDADQEMISAIECLPPEAQERASGGPIRDSKQRGMPWA